MKKWSGGVMILALAMILIFRYSLVGRQPQKQSAYSFFHYHPENDALTKDDSEFIMPSEIRVKTVPKPKPKLKPSTKPSKKPHLVNVQGLDQLYNSHNMSQQDSKALLVWAYMRPLLSRSDALPETAQGVKEASVAWKDLVSIIEEEKASDFSSSNGPENKNCPSSVNTLDKSVLGDGAILQFPCGLIEDSSISMLGIPDGPSGSFLIELIGSTLSGDSEPPIILHYNVSLPGNNMTEEPFIVQSTWTKELGWGKEERCPAHRSANSLKVDGLVLCNEQVVRSTSEENLNTSRPSNDMLTNVSKGSDHGTVSFPFVEGTPFTATLWVGLEGFHVTVNGRHETSFAYREKLEPWSVGKVKVSGGLNLLSALAKDLPVSEDHDLVVDVELLKAPSIPKKRLVMLVGVFSSGNNFERRMALRRSWMQYEPVRSGDVAVRFFIGLHKNKQVNYELWREAQAYGDIQLMPFVDYYSLISLKTIAICIMGTKVLPAKFIMKTDDDAFVRIDEVLSSLKEKSTNGLLYGLISFESSPQRDKDSKWYISNKEWPHASYPPWAHGPGYIISRDIAKFIVQGHQERDLQLFKLEDVAMGIWIEELRNSGQEVHYTNDERFFNAGCQSNYILAHYQSPRLVLCLWEKLLKEKRPNCCE
ncbi:hydroxyproline O-galactosyltransferase GALT3 [Ziziphus jujuba]|uniref:Hydroxyproline O-galactosyltransferase GALT3 n=1 Tax=Ziziphus jujuba TaxID=326968 RepID=A0A6P3YXL1_ZIZJJ|nr:hydroxyproline O-galactosyltransferase GALT3 [Ziziphus jujuba]XP_048320795.1 hydroxyproline O-galactosyltransferase GALT3 [Ziziphus jujuba]XP_060669024.1 hydroxyproline O-galactosyltransferase GALT3 [Ziziphus jujuba]